MIEALVYFIVAAVVTAVLLPILFAKELNLSSPTVSNSVQSSEPVPPPPPDRSKFNVFEDYYYTVKGDGVKIEGCVHTDCLALRIPSSINYTPVRSIGDMAFQDCNNLRKIFIPEFVVQIGYHAFPASEQLTIFAHSGSSAEQYARDNQIAFADAQYFDTPQVANVDTQPKTIESLNKVEQEPSKKLGYEDGYTEGQEQKQEELIRKFGQKLSAEEIADTLQVSKDYVQAVLQGESTPCDFVVKNEIQQYVEKIN